MIAFDVTPPARRGRGRPRTHSPVEALEPRTLLSVALVKDVNTDTRPSNPHDFTESGGLLFFAADDGAHGVELWKTDGTVAGTALVKDIDPRPVHSVLRWGPSDGDPPLYVEQGNSHPSALTDAGGTLFFYANDGVHGFELWKSDGTAAGTLIVKDINPGPGGSNDPDLLGLGPYAPVSIASLGGAAYFLATDGTNGWSLWRSDGTEAGTLPVRRFPDMVRDRESDLHALHGRIYFGAFEPATGWEPWVTDGTPAGTMLLTDAWPGPASSSWWQYAAAGGSVYFTGSTGVGAPANRGLWRTDGTPQGTAKVADGFSWVYLGSTGPRLFVGTSPLREESGTLWKLDPGELTLQRLRDFPALRRDGLRNFPRPFERLSDTTILFAVNDADTAVEPWRSDGTPAGTVLVADIIPGPHGSTPEEMVSLGGTVYFAGYTRPNDEWPFPVPGRERELFKTDGTAAGTVLVKDIFPGPGESSPSELTVYRGRVWFAATSAYETKRELWVTNGTEAGTVLFKDINTATEDGAHGPIAVGGKVFFVGTEPATGPEPWVTDGTEAGTRLLKDTVPGPDRWAPQFLKGANDQLFFHVIPDPSHPYDRDLWKTDGAPEGTVLVRRNVQSGAASGNPGVPFDTSFSLSGTLLFIGRDAEHGYELWRSDGTEAGTVMVKDINPGPGPSPIRFIATVGDAVLFWGAGGLWRTNGTAEGTVPVRAGIGSDVFFSPSGVTMDGVAYFTASDATTGLELWRSDGTEAGTRRVADLLPGTPGVNPRNFAVLNGAVYFLGSDGRYGMALYRSDGTEAGTARVPVDFGAEFFALSNLASAGGSLYFTLTASGRYGLSRGEVYRSDGTAAGTVRLRENVTGWGWTALGGKVYFTDFAGEDFTIPPFSGGAGAELWETDGTPAGTRLVADIKPGPASSDPQSLVRTGSSLLFTADDALHGRELWRFTPDGPPPPAAVVGRHVFYNNSAFDGNDPAANARDDGAIAADKVARLPGQRGGFANATSYDKGINGVMIDVVNLPAGATLTPNDFDATVRPRSVTVRRGAGVDGSDRITLIWPDYNPASTRANVDVVVNGWLSVTVKANERTGLASPDVFSFANLVGETGDSPPDLHVTALDLANVKRRMSAGIAAATNALDLNRDGRVNALDLALVRRNLGKTLIDLAGT